MKILVTGSNGQLGNELKVLASNYRTFQFLFHDVDTLDITNNEQLNKLFDVEKPLFVINCAAYTAVDKAETDTQTATLINATAVKNLVECCIVNNARLIHVSTDYVFDGTAHLPYKETDKVNPQSAYGRTKLEGEIEAQKDERSLVIRTSWLYSSFGNNFVKTVIRLSSERPEIGMIFDQIGSPTYAADLANTILQIVNQLKDTPNRKGGIYHFSNEGVCSWYDFALKIAQMKGNTSCKIKPIETHQYPLPANRPAYSVLNKAKIKSDFNIEIPWWETSLQLCIHKM